MNYWTEISVELANQRNYLDETFRVYPLSPDGLREINNEIWEKIEKVVENRDNINLIKELLLLKLFPIKDSYIAFLRKDKSSIERNPETVNRICGRLYEMGINEIYSRCSTPKETNRQIGPLFRNWLRKGSIGVPLLKADAFLATTDNAILDENDKELEEFAINHLEYIDPRKKGLDLVAKFNNKYIIGEAKFLTDFGGHQNAQFEDAKNLLNNTSARVIKIGILDGVLYIKSKAKMYKYLEEHPEQNIMSALVLREFLYQV